MKVQAVSKILISILWLSTLGVALCWLFWKNPPFDPEPITVVLGLISTAVTALLSEFDSKLQEEEFSLPFALAYGYVNNFVEPLISQLLKDFQTGKQVPRLFIYLPNRLSELEASNIDRVIGRMRMRNFEDKVINLQFQGGRARDILTVSQNNAELFYFDFPNTLLSLNSLIDYKIEAKRNRFTDSVKEEMAKDYIAKFSDMLKKMVAKKDLNDYVFFVDKELNFEKQGQC